MNKKNLSVFFIELICLLFSLHAYSKGKKDPFPSDVHVILIGFDGWGSYSVEKAEMPLLKKMMANGCWTLKKRSVLPSSSAANWASTFMGSSPEIHGFTQWNSMKPEIPSAIIGEHQIFPTIFQILHHQQENAEIGLFCNWSVIKHIVDSQSINQVVHFPVKKLKDKYSGMTKLVTDYIIKKRPTFCTVVYDYPDQYGHSSGFDSDDYYFSLKKLDKCLGDIIKATMDADIYEKTIFVVTSDHGGDGKKHGGKTLKELETPFVIFGNNIKKGCEIGQLMMQYDIASTIAYIFGLVIPQAWIGRPIMSIFERTR